LKRYSHIKDKSSHPLNSPRKSGQNDNESKEFLEELRELNEGVFKYQKIGDSVEICDRLLFITGLLENDGEIAELKRKKKYSKDKNNKSDSAEDMDKEIQRLKLEITPSLKPQISWNKIKMEK
jgi:hypothetical protein